VYYCPPASQHAALRGTYPASQHAALRGTYEVIKQMPERDGEFEYRIKRVTESNQRVARESELSKS